MGSEITINKKYDSKIEIWNTISHGLGVLLGIGFLIYLVAANVKSENLLAVVGFSIYGACFILMFLMSTIYHGVQNPKAKRILRVFDHISIYYFIAGSFTPVILLALEGTPRIVFMAVIWSIALLGTIYKIVSYKNYDKFKMLSTIIYIGMGWLAVFLIKPIINTFPPQLVFWLVFGGVVYTAGTFFYKYDKLKYHHVIWHFFVLIAAISHFIGFVYIV
ncbi:MAG: hemolysin III family protein [Tissierellia bacterium]|nr:hemolysin III family protein [Tissierellia bacterium]